MATEGDVKISPWLKCPRIRVGDTVLSQVCLGILARMVAFKWRKKEEERILSILSLLRNPGPPGAIAVRFRDKSANMFFKFVSAICFFQISTQIPIISPKLEKLCFGYRVSRNP